MSNDCGFLLQPADVPQLDRQGGGLHFDPWPFGLVPNTDILFWTDAHRQAADVLREGIEHGSPVVLLTGETGSGKTTLVHDLLADRRPDLTIGLLPSLGGGRDDFCASLLRGFGQQDPGSTRSKFPALQAFAMAEHDAGRRCVLVVDEAQCAADDELEFLRLLTNLDAGRHRLLQVVLVGQPALRTRLGDARRASLAARIGADAHLSAMSEEETARYVLHRLTSTGGRADAFTPGALAAVHRIADGVPRRTNLLCGLCVTEANRREAPAVDTALVGAVASAARQDDKFPGLFGSREGVGDARLFPVNIAAAPPSGGAPLAARPVTGKARKEAAAGWAALLPPSRADAARALPLAPPPAAVRSDCRRRCEDATASAANSPRRIEAIGQREPAPSGKPGPAAQAQDPAARLSGETAEDVHQLAFDAMASLADYESPKQTPRRRDIRTKESSTSRTDARRNASATRAQQRHPADPRPAPPVGLRGGTGFGLATAAVLLVILGIGSHMVWSVHDVLSAGSNSRSQIAVATPEARLGEPGTTARRSGDEAPRGGPVARRAVPMHRPALTTPALPTVAAPNTSAAGLFSLALDLSLVDRETAAIAFARAASRGHERAAYYLAQIYETGDGVPRNLALARAWYAASGSTRAIDRLASLGEDEPSKAASPPHLLSAARTSDGMLELVWSSGTEGSDVEYLIEVLDGVDQSTVHTERVAHSSYRLSAPKGELLWRVTVETPATALTSELQRIPAADLERRPSGFDRP